MTMSFENCLLGILKKKNVLKEADLKRILEQRKITEKKLTSLLVDEGLMTERDIVSLVSNEAKIPILPLGLIKIDPEVIRLVPKKIAEQHQVIPIAKLGQMLTVGMVDPLNVFSVDDLREITGHVIRPVMITPKDMAAAFDTNYSETANMEDFFEMDDVDVDSVQVTTEADTDDGEVKSIGGEAPVIRMVNLILQEGIKRRASDIHFEPYQNKFRIRYRIDGILREAFTPPRQMYTSILARLKIVSDLNITEKRLPQDGRFRAKLENKEIDFRVSLLPTFYGEKAVLRVLDKASLSVGLANLGFTEAAEKIFQEVVKRPYGMILVTGPTGSGKSTTLYAVLNQMNTHDRNIMTIEDPVEYQVKGITQTQVNPDIGLTFSNGLRALLRQSPDVILVGEIRDMETADIAVKAALTGHLLFSTLHTNNAASTVTRLVDMGIEPFLVASSLIAATAQRLLRRICKDCKEQTEITSEVLERLKLDRSHVKGITPFKGKGCNTCNHTGYKGRIATMEIMVVNDQIQQMIIDRAPSNEIEKVSRKNGMKTLFENSFLTFQAGNTTLEEVLRVVSGDH